MILNLYLNRTLNRILNLNLSEKKKKLWMEGVMKDIVFPRIDCHMHSISAHYISVHQKFINKQQPC